MHKGVGWLDLLDGEGGGGVDGGEKVKQRADESAPVNEFSPNTPVFQKANIKEVFVYSSEFCFVFV